MDPQRKGLSTYQPQAITKIQQLTQVGRRPRLLDLVIEHRRCTATDDRDKIYGLLGLGNYDIRAEYAKPVEEVYTDFAVKQILDGGASTTDLESILCSEGSRDFFCSLYSAGALNQKLTLPSWVPDWSVDFKSTPLWPVNNWSLEDQEFAASGKPRSSTTALKKLHETTSLELTAKIWESIKVAGTVNLDLSVLKAHRKTKSTMTAWIQEANPNYGSQQVSFLLRHQDIKLEQY